MKKYIIFAISFLGLFVAFQLVAGMLLTVTYTPDVNEAWIMSGSLSQETIIATTHNPFLLTLIIAFLSATIAYFIPEKIRNTRQH